MAHLSLRALTFIFNLCASMQQFPLVYCTVHYSSALPFTRSHCFCTARLHWTVTPHPYHNIWNGWNRRNHDYQNLNVISLPCPQINMIFSTILHLNLLLSSICWCPPLIFNLISSLPQLLSSKILLSCHVICGRLASLLHYIFILRCTFFLTYGTLLSQDP